MNDVFTTLQHLVLMAEESIRGRGHARLERIEPLNTLTKEVERQVKMPRDTERFVEPYALTLAVAIRDFEMALDARDEKRTIVYSAMIGLLLPFVRVDCARALMAKVKVPS